MIKGLEADGPAPELREKLMLFGQFVGDWEIDAKYFRPDGTTVTENGELHVGWILNGRAIQDVWISHGSHPERSVAAGTTIRFYDPAMKAWQCVWISPLRGTTRTFVARKVGTEIVLEGTTQDGYPERWIFSEIMPRSFTWRAVESRDGEKTWQLTEEMVVRRVGADQ
jgi:hypothetical protein